VTAYNAIARMSVCHTGGSIKTVDVILLCNFHHKVIIIIIIVEFVKRHTRSYKGASGGVNQAA